MTGGPKVPFIERHRLSTLVVALLAITCCGSFAAPVFESNEPFEAAGTPATCCASVAQLPAPETLRLSQTVSLVPTSPHFEFGEGNVPFAHFAMGPGCVRLVKFRVFRRAPPPDLAEDTDLLHYVYPRAYFFDSSGQLLSGEEQSSPNLESARGIGNYELTLSAVVPATATQVVIASAASRTNSGGQSFAYTPPKSVSGIAGRYFYSFGTTGESRQRRFMYHPYGRVQVTAWGAPLGTENRIVGKMSYLECWPDGHFQQVPAS